MRQLPALLLAVCALFLAPLAHAQSFPALSGRVVDQADLLDPAQEAALTTKLAAFETQTQRQFVVATVSDLEGYDIADYGYRLGRHWAIGDKERNDGLLLLVAPNERKVRFEVGYGLEAYMTDAFSHRVIQDRILPEFRNGNFPRGIETGVDAAIAQLQLPPEEAAKIAAAAERDSGDEGGEIGMVIFWLFVFFFFILPVIVSIARGGRKHRRGRSRHWGGPVVIWGGGSGWGGGGSSSWGGGGGGFGGFSGGGGSFGGGGASGGW